MPVLERALDLIKLLRRPSRGATRKELESRWRCSPATVHRIFKHCRENLNVPVRYHSVRKAYILDADAAMEAPGLWLSPGELAALLGLSHWLETLASGVLKEKLDPIRARLEAGLAERGILIADWEDRIRLLPMAFRPVDPGVLFAAAQAALERRLSRFEYKGMRDAVFREREVSPQTLVRYRDNWYLDGFDHRLRKLRSFALSRMRGFRALSQSAKDIPRPDLDAHFADAYGIFGGRAGRKASLLFDGLAAKLAFEERWHPRQRVRLLPGGKTRLEFPCGDVRELARDVMRYAGEVTVEGPDDLRLAVEGMVRQAWEKIS